MMTTITTLGAIVMTPLLCKLLLGTVVPVDAVGIAFSTIQVRCLSTSSRYCGRAYATSLPKMAGVVLTFATVMMSSRRDLKPCHPVEGSRLR